jgi:hypothetical protein
MQLGDLINALQDEQTAATTLQSLTNLVLSARTAEMAAAFDESIGQYVAASIGRFAATADDESWLRLIGDVERSDDPGAAALTRMLLWALDDDARSAMAETNSVKTCGCGAGHGACHETG